MSDPEVVLTVGALLMIGVVAASIADRLQVPAYALSLVVGMAIGSDGAGWVQFDDYLTVQRLGTACLALILFEGGWRSRFSELRSVWGVATRLAVPGTILTALATGVAVSVLFGIPTVEGLLIGSILASTDGAAVFGLLRRSGLHRRLVLTLEAEAGLNDPVAILLVISLVSWIQGPSGEPSDIALLFGRQLLLGLACGICVGFAGGFAFKNRWLPVDGLYSVASLAIAALAFGAAQTLDASGFLAVYIAGLVLGNEAQFARKSTTVFQQGLASLADIALFITLGLVVSPSELTFSAAEGVAVALVLAFIGRPLAVFVMTAGESFSPAEKVLLSWAGLRGAVPVVLATIPVIQGVPDSATFFNLSFVAVLASALLQGVTVRPLARALGLATSSTALPNVLAETREGGGSGVLEADYVVPPESDVVGRNARDLRVPVGTALSVIVRSGHAFSPSATTRLRVGDTLRFLVSAEAADVLQATFWTWGESPWSVPGALPPQTQRGRGDGRWVPFRADGLRAHMTGLRAEERSWWRQVVAHLRP